MLTPRQFTVPNNALQSIMACTAFRHLRMAGNVDYPSHNHMNSTFPLSLRARAPDVVTGVSLSNMDLVDHGTTHLDRDGYELEGKFPDLEINVTRDIESK